MKDFQKILIVGGGVIGSFAAYYLAGQNRSITIIDKGRFGAGASAGNCGLIVPNHVLPLNDLSNLLTAFFWMFKSDAPLRIRPRFDLELIRWFIAFTRRCRRQDILNAARGCHALLQSSFSIYPRIIDAENIECEWQVAGSLHVYRSQKKWRAYQAIDRKLRHYGIEAEPMDPDAMLTMEPRLADDLAGGWYYRNTAQLRPEKLLSEMRRLLAAKGVRIVENRAVLGVEAQKGRAVGVRTEEGSIAADAIVVAAGAWTPMFADALGCRIPIQPGKGFSMTMKPPSNSPGLPLFFEEQRVIATPWQSGFRLGGTMEFAGYDATLSRNRLAALSRAALRYLREFNVAHVEEEWCSFRPMTYDGLPIIDRSARYRNVIIAAGHNMLGLSMGPASGRLVAELLDGVTPHIDPRPYRVDRVLESSTA